MRLIDADALDEKLKCTYRYFQIAGDIAEAPTIDAEPVKHGKWLTTDAYPHHLYCSACYKTYLANNEWLDTLDVPTNYCPNCGAKMYEEES